MGNRKKCIAFGMFFLALLLIINGVNAAKLLCLEYGDKLPPNSSNPQYVCLHNSCLNICVNDNFYSTNPSYCTGQVCQLLGVDGTVDVEPPILMINSPKNEEVYNARSVLFDLKFNEPSSIYYIDNINGRGQWKRICSNCQNSYSQKISVKEGFNNFTIKAEDRNGQSTEKIVVFMVDSKKPKIAKTEPKKGFTNGDFYVEIHEKNPEKLNINYGVLGNYKTQNINLSKCVPIKGNSEKLSCDVSVNLDEFSGKNIEYWFDLTDIAETKVESKHLSLMVDVVSPAISNLNSYWIKVGKYVYFNISVNEINFDEIIYRDNSALRPNWKTLCSSLKNGICAKKITLSQESAMVDLQLIDKAGNSIGVSSAFNVV